MIPCWIRCDLKPDSRPCWPVSASTAQVEQRDPGLPRNNRRCRIVARPCRASVISPFQPLFWRANSIWSLNDRTHSKIDPPFPSSDRIADSGNGAHSETPETEAIIKKGSISRIEEYRILDEKERKMSNTIQVFLLLHF